MAQPVHDADTVGVEGTAFPFEQSGILQEVMVRRTKKAPASKRKKNEEGKGTSEYNLMNSLNEDLSPIDEHALKNIVGGILVLYSLSVYGVIKKSILMIVMIWSCSKSSVVPLH